MKFPRLQRVSLHQHAVFSEHLCSPRIQMYSFPWRNGFTQLIKPQGPLKREELTTVCLPGCSVDAENLEWEAKQKVEPDWAGAGPGHLPPPLDPLCLELSENTGVPSPPPSQNGYLQRNSKTHSQLVYTCWRKMQGKWTLAPCQWERESVQSHGD